MKNLHNKQGSVLIIALGFFVVFTMLGLAALHIAGVENELAEKQITSDEAFWLADGWVDRSLSNLPGTLLKSMDDTGNYVDTISDGADRWKIISKRTVSNSASNTRSRKIIATAAKYDIKDAYTTSGEVKGWTINDDGTVTDTQGSMDLSGTAQENAVYSFESVFNGWSFTQICQAANNISTLTMYPSTSNCGQVEPPPANSPNNNGYDNSSPTTGVTIIQFGKNDASLSLNSGDGLVIIDTRTSKQNSPTVTINNTVDFEGVIWIIGEANINGGADISGAVFVNGEANIGNGNGAITYDANDIADALDNLGPTFTNKDPYLVAWEEDKSDLDL